jgi:hypothetical protein
MISLTEKLNPARFTAMSGVMAAALGCILGERLTEPQIASILVTSNGFALATHVGEIGYNHLIGWETDLKRNWVNLLDAADLTEEERGEAFRLYDLRVCV